MPKPSRTHALQSIHRADLPLVASRFTTARRDQGFSQPELVREAGYRNINKGLRRLRHLESGSPKAPDHRIIERFGYTLGLDLDALATELRHRQRKRQQARQKEAPPQPPRILGALLQKARNRRGLSIPQLVARLDVPHTDRLENRIKHLESGQLRLPTQTELLNLARPLALCPNRLLQARHNEADQIDRTAEPARMVLEVSPVIARSHHRYHQGDHPILEFLEHAETLAAREGWPAAIYNNPFPTIYVTPDGTRHCHRDSFSG